ncbi:FtsX-like permease family protein [Ktedonospora formicarum]|nr:FtsX-like permease family protein [Ktedonospora formicarum]
MGLGTVVALLLGTCSNALMTWNSLRERQINFAVLRALGTEPLLVTQMLAWEQGLIYLLALPIGITFGLLLTLTLIPNLIISSTPVAGTLGNLSGVEYNLLQHTLPVRVQPPLSLVFTLLALVGIAILSVYLIARSSRRTILAQTIRLSQD